MKQKQQGFTLIELVVVIIILGILAVTAAPKFLNLKGDAYRGALQGAKASLQSANEMVHAKSILAGNNTAAQSATPAPVLNLDSSTVVELSYGYLDATSDNISDVLDIDVSGSDKEFNVEAKTGTADPATIAIRPEGAPAGCQLVYKEAANANSKPTYTLPAASDC